jgi:hypothetical protein
MEFTRYCLAVLFFSLVLWGAVALAVATGVPATSSEAAGMLVSLMKSQALDAVAVQDPDDAERFIAAMLVPDVQLLVVAAKSTAPEYLREQLTQRRYRDAYGALFSGAVMETKVFIQDMGCDGLTQNGGNIDILYERGTTQTVFNGDWKEQKLSKAAYAKKLRDAESKYSRMLTLLSQQLRGGAAAG